MYALNEVKKGIIAQKKRLKYYKDKFKNEEILEMDFDIAIIDIKRKLSHLQVLNSIKIHRDFLALYENNILESINIGSPENAIIKSINTDFHERQNLDYEVDKIYNEGEIKYYFDNLKRTFKQIKYKDLLKKDLKKLYGADEGDLEEPF